MQPGWCQPVRQEFMENECEALPGVAYPGVRDNRSTLNTKTGYDEYAIVLFLTLENIQLQQIHERMTVVYSEDVPSICHGQLLGC